MTRWRWGRALALAALATGAGVASAQAATPVANGGFAWVAPNARIVTALPDGSHRVQVSHGPGKDLDPAYSPDGSQIAFDSTRTGGGDIYVMNADGSGVVRLTTDPAEDSQPAWSPDGNRIAFTRCGSTACHIWVMTSAGANQHPDHEQGRRSRDRSGLVAGRASDRIPGDPAGRLSATGSGWCIPTAPVCGR